MNGNETKGYFYLPLPELFSPRVVGLEIVEASRGRDFCVRDVVAVKFNIYTMTTIQKLLNLVVTTRINKKQRIVKIKNSNLFPLNDQSSSLQQEGRNN